MLGLNFLLLLKEYKLNRLPQSKYLKFSDFLLSVSCLLSICLLKMLLRELVAKKQMKKVILLGGLQIKPRFAFQHPLYSCIYHKQMELLRASETIILLSVYLPLG